MNQWLWMWKTDSGPLEDFFAFWLEGFPKHSPIRDQIIDANRWFFDTELGKKNVGQVGQEMIIQLIKEELKGLLNNGRKLSPLEIKHAKDLIIKLKAIGGLEKSDENSRGIRRVPKG